MNTFSSMRPSEKIATFVAVIVLIFSTLMLYQNIKKHFGVEVADFGGVIHEGMVGNPRYINPILASSDIDKNLSNVIYSGLLKTGPNGQLIPDLAESWSVSDNGLVYTININPKSTFHDGKPVTVDDVIFTIETALNPDINSPIAGNWSGVTVKKIDNNQLTFTLKKAYVPFVENLTMGILPKHIWENIPAADFDLGAYYQTPIGSGPFKVKTIKQAKDGFIDQYELESFKKYNLGRAFLDKLVITFFRSESEAIQAFEDGEIDTLGSVSPTVATTIHEDDTDVQIKTNILPRIFAVFFNQNSEPVFLNKEVRRALDISVNKQLIIDEVLKGYGKSINSPLPITPDTASLTASSTLNNTPQVTDDASRITQAKQILEKAGWTQNASTSIYEKKSKDKIEKLSFTLSTSNSPELIRTAELLKEQWTKIGADVKIESFDSSDLTQKVIRPRKYGALLFGQIVGRDIDLYPFWHSTQRVDPGLNIAMYANTKANAALDVARSSNDRIKKIAARADFAKEIANDIPAVFLFSPEYIYVQNIPVFTDSMEFITEPSDRFININRWYLGTTYQWKK